MSGPWDDYTQQPAAPAPPQEAGPWDDFAQPASSFWGNLGKAFNPVMRVTVGALSGGPVGAVAGLLTAAQQASEPVQPTRMAHGALEAAQAGYQASATGLLQRGRLPDIVLDPSHKKWYESAISAAASTISDLPEMIAGGAAAGVAGLPTGPGALALGGAAAFATPTAIRQALMTAYSLNQVQSSSDFLSRVGVGIEETGKSAIVGAAMGPAGLGAKSIVGPVAERAFGEAGAKIATQAAGLGTEYGVLTVAPAALEGRLPEKEDFINNAILLGGFHAAGAVSQGLQNVYARTGVRPEEVARDAQADPTILEDLAKTSEYGSVSFSPSAPTTITVPEGFNVSYTSAGKPSYIDTRGSGIVLHGTSRPIDSPSDFHYSTQNIYGQGFYTTDGLDIAKGYSKKGRGGNPNIYAVTVAPGVGDKLFDMERPVADPKIIAAVNGAIGGMDIPDIKPGETLRQFYDAAREESHDTGYSADSIQELFQSIQENLKDMGFRGFSHTGGGFSGRAPHSVNIFWNPETDVSLKPLDISKFEVPKAPIGTRGELQQLFGNPPGPASTVEPNPLKSTVNIADSTSYQGVRQGPLMGPMDERMVARDPATGKDMGRLWVTKTPEGFEVRKVEVDPKFRGQDVATQLYLEARDRYGPYQGSTDTTPDGQALLAKLRENQPGIFEPTQAAPVQPEPEVPRAYREAADQQAAADAVPGIPISDTTRAIASDLFGPRVQAPGEPEPTHVNYKYLNTPEQVNGALARMSDLNLEEIQRQRRGTVPWEQTEHEAGVHLGRLLGSDGPIQAREPGTAAGAAELLGRKQMVEGAALDTVAKAKAIAEAPGAASPEQLADLLVSVDRASMIQSEFLGARAEAGRALNILKDTKTTAERAEQIQAVLGRFGKDPVELAKQLAQIDNPEAAARAARRMTAPGWEQKALEVWKAGLVSGPVTQVANIMGNTTYAATRPLVDATASIFGMLTRAEDRVHYTEPLARILGDFQGTIDGLKQARTAFMVEEPGGKAESRNAIPGKLGYVIRTPFRALEALDVMFRAMNDRGEAYAMGAREAAKEGLNPATREFRERAVDLANNPPEDWIDSIEAFGKRATFRMPLGEKGKAITEAIVKNHLEWIVPFRGTPANIFKELTRLSPAAPVIGEWRADWAKGGADAAKAVAEMTVGSSIAALTMNYAFSGHISGAGDPDPAKRRVQMAAGWQPYSVKIGNTWYSYQRFQPVGTLIGMAADVAEVWEHMNPEESDKVPRMLAVAFSNAVTNQTFLQGITMLVDALSEPDRRGPRLIQNMTASAVPAVVGQTAQFMDDYKREITNTREAVMNRIPGLREQLPVQRDPWGEPAMNPSRLGVISPVIESTPSQDKVRTEAARLGVGAQKAPQAITIPTRGLVQGSMAQVQLTPEQRDVFASVAGKTAHQIMTQMVNSPTWDETPDVIKGRIFQAVMEKSNRLGPMAALSDSQRQQEIERVVGEVQKRLEK